MKAEFIGKLNKHIESLPAFEGLAGEIGSRRTINISGLRGSASSLVVNMISDKVEGPVLWITPDFERAKVNFKNLTSILGRRDWDARKPAKDATPPRIPVSERKAFLFDDLDLLSQDFLSLTDVEVMYYRYQALEKLVLDQSPIVVISKRSLMSPLISPERFKKHIVSFNEGDTIDKPEVVLKLVGMGYRLVTRVEEMGEVSSRGGILDIFPLGRDLPLRLDLFGEEIESIREFDPITQRSQRQVNTIVVSPCFEANVISSGTSTELLDDEGNFLIDTIGGEEELPPLREFNRREKEAFIKGQYAFFDKATILDFLPSTATVILEAPTLVFTETLRGMIEPVDDESGESDAEAGDGAYLPEYDQTIIDPEEIRRKLGAWSIINLLSPLDGQRANTHEFRLDEIRHPSGSFEKRIRELTDAHAKEDLFIVTRSRERVQGIIEEWGRKIDIDYGDM